MATIIDDRGRNIHACGAGVGDSAIVAMRNLRAKVCSLGWTAMEQQIDELIAAYGNETGKDSE